MYVLFTSAISVFITNAQQQSQPANFCGNKYPCLQFSNQISINLTEYFYKICRQVAHCREFERDCNSN